MIVIGGPLSKCPVCVAKLVLLMATMTGAGWITGASISNSMASSARTGSILAVNDRNAANGASTVRPTSNIGCTLGLTT